MRVKERYVFDDAGRLIFYIGTVRKLQILLKNRLKKAVLLLEQQDHK